VRVAAGAQLGVVFPFGLDGIAIGELSGGRRVAVDLSWQPSAYWQSYSLGAAFHPLRGPWFAGGRLRYLQLHAPWSRGFDGDLDHQLGLGVELGARGWLDGRRRLLGTVSIGVLVVPSDNTSLPLLYTLCLGLAYGVWSSAP